MTNDLSVAFLTPSVSRSAGGILEVERRLAQRLSAFNGVNVEVFGAHDEFTEKDSPEWSPINVHVFPFRGPANFRWSPPLRRAFLRHRADIAHLHALWTYSSIVIHAWARQNRAQYVTTLHGMLDPWAVKHAGWKKRISAAIYERSCLNDASCLHVFSERELASARNFGLRNPACLIPNGVDLPPPVATGAPWNGAVPVGKKVLLYLGRLHPKKGLVNLLKAWHALRWQAPSNFDDWRLVIAGWDQGGHENYLKSIAVDLALRDTVTFTGPLFGEAKDAAYHHSAAFVLPSLSEGLPMVVLEAWAHGKPVLITPQCNLPEGVAADAAIASQPDPDRLAEGLVQMIDATDDERAAMGRRGLDLVQRQFTWDKVATEVLAVYRWIVGGGQAPSCVVTS